MSYILWQWQPPATGTPDTYNLYRGAAAGAETLYQAGLTALSYQDESPVPGTCFGYVTAVTGGVESGPSNESSVVVAVPVPSLFANGQVIGGVPAILLTGY
jgi:hypothetical protein